MHDKRLHFLDWLRILAFFLLILYHTGMYYVTWGWHVKSPHAGSYADFMGLYLRAYGGFCKDGECLTLPTWNHLWYLPYVWVYTLVLAALATLAGRERLERASTRLARLLTGWRALALPAALLALVRIALKPYFEETHALTDDWFNHATYLPLFLAGALLGGQAQFWRELDRLRWPALGIALACWAALVAYISQPEALQTWTMAARMAWAACQWCAIVAACGFARRHLAGDGPARRYLTEAVFPVYILHQTLIVCFSRVLRTAALPPVTEGVVLVVLTVAASFAIFEIVRRVALLRPLFGLKKRDRDAAPPAVQAAPRPVPDMAALGNTGDRT